MKLTFEANMKSLGSHDQGLFQLLSYMYLFYYLNWISVAWNTSTVRYEKKNLWQKEANMQGELG